MGESHKPPAREANRSQPAPEDDSMPFSIETTTMRLRSLKKQRAEAAERELARAQKTAAKNKDSGATTTVRIRPAGRVRHDDRGQAVWDWAVASGEFAQLSTTSIVRKLDVGGLAIEQTGNSLKPPVRESGADPYNQVRGAPGARPARAAMPVDSGDPYNQAGALKPSAVKRPTPAAARPATKPAPQPEKKRNSVLDQLLGRRK